jgi:putative ABC transport system permease protein
MNKFLHMFLRHWRKSPLKMFLTVFSVALGTGILVISFSASSIIKDKVTAGMAKNGSVLYVSNATWNSDGSLEQIRPTEWDADAPSKLASDSGVVKEAALIVGVPFDEFAVNGNSYRLRSAIGTDPNYFDVFGLRLAAGAPMGQEDITNGAKHVWISEELANILFGSAEGAVGKQIQTKGSVFRRGPASNAGQNLINYYSVSGVFATPSEVARRSYGIGDMVFPYTAMIDSTSSSASFQKKMMSSTFVVKTSGGASIKRAEASIRETLATFYGDKISVAVWEGSPQGESTYLEQLRQAISIFTVSINILGLVLLVISSLGIFSVMVVELLGRKREIALERAIGASQSAVVREFWAYSVALSLIGAVIGIVLAIPLSAPVLKTLAPLLGEVSAQFGASTRLTLASILGGLGLALGCGGILGALPAFSAVKGNISETLREV